MKILSDTFKIEATYDELLFMYEGMMKILDEIIEERKRLMEENKGIPCDRAIYLREWINNATIYPLSLERMKSF